jgi:hypothetical protein
VCPWLLLILLLLLPLQLHSAAHYNLLLQQLGDVCCLLVAVADNQRDSGLLAQQSVAARLSLQILMIEEDQVASRCRLWEGEEQHW